MLRDTDLQFLDITLHYTYIYTYIYIYIYIHIHIYTASSFLHIMRKDHLRVSLLSSPAPTPSLTREVC
jgi:hypothetical protein